MIRRRPRGTVLASLGALALLGCQTTPKPVPALRPAAGDFRVQVRALCLLPLDSQASLPDEPARLAAFEALLVDRLKRGEYHVVPAEQTVAAYRRATQQLGGAFDPHTGRRDAARYTTVRRQALHQVGTELGCQALLDPTIAVVSAPFSNGFARWDGVDVEVSDAFGAPHGWITALSLWVSILDFDDQEVFFNTGGIQPIFQIEMGVFDDELKPVPEAQLLTDPARNQKAIDVCLEPVLAWLPYIPQGS